MLGIEDGVDDRCFVGIKVLVGWAEGVTVGTKEGCSVGTDDGVDDC